MTYSLNTLNGAAGGTASPRGAAGRFAHEIALVLGLAALVFWGLWHARRTFDRLDMAALAA